MDDQLKMMAWLIHDAHEETEKLKRYDRLIIERCGDNAEAAKAADAELRYMRVPSRERVRDALRMIRRISLDIEREL